MIALMSSVMHFIAPKFTDRHVQAMSRSDVAVRESAAQRQRAKKDIERYHKCILEMSSLMDLRDRAHRIKNFGV